MCKTPDIVVEVTLQPVTQFDLDAAIIFSDILLPLEKMGIPVQFTEGEGPVIGKPVRSRKDVEAMRPIDPEEDLGYVLEAIGMTRRELEGNVPLIGFCGAPFTLASYIIEGGGSKNYQATKTMMYNDSDTFRLLMEKLTDMVFRYLNSQIIHGAQAVQVFDSWAGVLSSLDYATFVLPHMKRLFSSLDTSVPAIHFGVNTSHLLRLVNQAGGNVIGVDWRLTIDEAWDIIGPGYAIQGNLDPTVLFSSPRYIEQQVKDLLQRVKGSRGHIFNLGHGVMPGTPVEHVRLLVDAVHEYGRNDH
jgi:uroporphyrinogen decarboxylase